MKVPKRNTGGTYYDGIAAVVGKDAANKLVSKYGGNRIKVPRCQRLLTIERWRKIIADFSAGATLNELARKYGLTERGISKALKHAV